MHLDHPHMRIISYHIMSCHVTSQAVEAGAADEARRAAYESGKAKLRKAMADPTLQDELDDLDEVSPSVCFFGGGGG
jgi:hypothetical protein